MNQARERDWRELLTGLMSQLLQISECCVTYAGTPPRSTHPDLRAQASISAQSSINKISRFYTRSKEQVTTAQLTESSKGAPSPLHSVDFSAGTQRWQINREHQYTRKQSCDRGWARHHVASNRASRLKFCFMLRLQGQLWWSDCFGIEDETVTFGLLYEHKFRLLLFELLGASGSNK